MRVDRASLAGARHDGIPRCSVPLRLAPATRATQPDSWNDAGACSPLPRCVGTPEIWNPLPRFDTVHQDNQVGKIGPLYRFCAAANAGTLRAPR